MSVARPAVLKIDSFVKLNDKTYRVVAWATGEDGTVNMGLIPLPREEELEAQVLALKLELHQKQEAYDALLMGMSGVQRDRAGITRRS